MTERQEIREALVEAIGEEGCGASCAEADIFVDEEGWKMQLPTFMGPWKLGGTLEEAKATIKELASQGFGVSSGTY